MTAYEKNESLLKAFCIPAGEGEVTEKVRHILARLLAARSLRLAQLQTARDIYERAGKDDPRLYLFLAAMFLSEGQGNAYMRVEKVPSLLKEGGYLDDYEKAGFDKDNQQFSEEVKEHFADIDWNRCAEPLLGDIIVREGENWYFQRNQASVADVNKRLKAFVDANKKMGKMGDVADAVVKKAAQFNGFTLNKEQEKALAAAAGNRFTVITGGPGTGKTTTVCAILRALFAAHSDWTEKDIALAAPTGRAAQRMSEAVLDQCVGLEENAKTEGDEAVAETKTIVEKIGKLKGSTIHRLLGGYAPKWNHDEKNKLEQKVVIVDETSMVDIYLMHALISALKDETRLILLGDADQLPSVDTGAVLGDLTKFGMNEKISSNGWRCASARRERYPMSRKRSTCCR